jgi:CubicO group peptidase (beta-lactamase class C family)
MFYCAVCCATVLGSAWRPSTAAAAPSTNIPSAKVLKVEGVAVPALAAFDEAITNFMTARGIERASFALSRNGQPVLLRAFTLGSLDATPTSPTNLFRIASISKPITSVAIMQLIEAGRLNMDQPIGGILDLASAVDPRMKAVTIRQLLQHRGGWDSAVSFDPMFHDFAIAKRLHTSLPTTPQMVIDYMKTVPLDFEPGSRYAYSNFGYCLLGRIVEAISGQRYEEYVREHVLAPIGISDMRIGHSLLSRQFAAEVNYQDSLARMVPSVAGKDSTKVPVQYGGWNLNTMDAHGGWVATALDLVRFASAFDVKTNSPLLGATSIDQMWSRPQDNSTNASFYAAGWAVRELNSAGSINTWHNGSLDGSTTLMVHRWDRLNWALLLNSRETAPGKHDYLQEIDPALHVAAKKIVNWPLPHLAGDDTGHSKEGAKNLLQSRP